MTQACSIDDYLSAHFDDKVVVDYGKIAVTSAILQYERGSTLFCDPAGARRFPDFGALRDTWFHDLLQCVVQDCKLQDVRYRLAQLQVVNFNYDRCLERFMQTALQSYYNIDVAEAESLVAEVSIIRPYGSIGRLKDLEFGAVPLRDVVQRQASCVRVLPEGAESSFDRQGLLRDMSGCNRIVFLGFAFHRANLRLLLPEPGRQVTAVGYASSFGLSDSARALIEQEVCNGGMCVEMHMKPGLKSADMMREYRRSLALG